MEITLTKENYKEIVENANNPFSLTFGQPGAARAK